MLLGVNEVLADLQRDRCPKVMSANDASGYRSRFIWLTKLTRNHHAVAFALGLYERQELGAVAIGIFAQRAAG
jgi:hypothetical protein